MATELRRFTVSITPHLQVGLDAAKKEVYYKDTQAAMIRDLIARGLDTLDALKTENGEEFIFFK